MCWANHAKKNLVITLTAIQGGKKEVITKKVRIKGPSSGNSGVSRFRLWRERQQAKRAVARAEYHYAWNSMKKWKKFLWIGLMALTIVMIVLSITKGCASAAMCLASHPDDFEGLVLLAAYSTKDLSKSGKKVISIYGSNDGVLNMKKYNEYMKNLPEDFMETVIESGNHGYFAIYGHQDGDGDATISRSEQIRQTASAICRLLD